MRLLTLPVIHADIFTQAAHGPDFHSDFQPKSWSNIRLRSLSEAGR